MTNYTKTTNFATKDTLPSGNANKIVKGTEIDTEFNNIATAVATKADTAGPTFTGTVTIPTVDLNGGAIDGTTVGASTAAAITGTTIVANTSINIAGDGATVTGIKDEDDMSSNSATKLATQQSIKAYVDSQVTAQDLDFQADSGGALSIDLDSETLTFTGGTGVDTSGSGNAVTFAIDSTVATLTGSQTLSNKTLATPVVSGNLTTNGLIDGRDVATDGTKLDGIEASADVTDTANVTAAGALMDSELTDIAAVKALNQGVATTDSPTFAGLTTTANVSFGDNDKAIFGADIDLQIYHDGSGSFIEDVGTGFLKITSNGDGILLQKSSTETMAQFLTDGAVTLYHDNSLILSTSSSGIDVTGTVTANGLQIDGAATITQSAGSNFLKFDVDGTIDEAILGIDSTDFIIDIDPTNVRASSNFVVKNDGTTNLTLNSNGDLDVNGTVTADGLTVSPSGTQQVLATLRANSGAGGGLVVQTDASDDGLIRGYDSSGNIQLQFDTDGGDNYIAQGNVGIGTSSPAAKIHLKDTTGTAVKLLQLETAWSSPSGNKSIEWTDATNTLGRISVDYTAPKASMRFGSLYNSDYQTGDVMTLTADGNVGIGTSSPSATLALDKNTTTQHRVLDLENNSITYSMYVDQDNSSTNSWSLFDTTNSQTALRYLPSSSGYWQFYTNNAERMRIDTSGNLIVGNTSDSAASSVTLQNDGDIRGVLSTGAGGDTLISAISGVSNGYQISVTTGNAQTYKWHNGGTQSMTLDSSGNLLVGTTTAADVGNLTAAHLLEGGSSSSGTGVVGIYNNTGTASCPALVVLNRDASTDTTNRFVQFYANVTSSSSTAMGGIVGNGASNAQFASISDAREKTNIESISGSLDKINALNPVEFDWIASGEHVNAGFVAQEVEQVFPEFVVENLASEGEEERKGLTGGMTGGIVAHLVKAIQEQQATITALESRITQLENN